MHMYALRYVKMLLILNPLIRCNNYYICREYGTLASVQ